MSRDEDIARLQREQAERKAIKRTPHDNSKDWAGSDMQFPCIDCGEPVIVPENYTPPRRSRCRGCEDLHYYLTHPKS